MQLRNAHIFASNKDGGLAVVFVLTLTIMVAFIGLAVDTGRAMRTASIIRASLDSAALAGAKTMVEDEGTFAEVEERVRRVLKGQLTTSGIDSSYWDGLNISTDQPNGRVVVTLDMSVPTTFARVVNYNAITAKMQGQAAYKIRPAEVSLVLDITGSMNDDNKLDDLKLAAKEAVATLLPVGPLNFNRIALAPYAGSVNAGVMAAAVSDSNSLDGCVVERDGPEAYTEEDPAGVNHLRALAETPPGPNAALPAPYDMNVYNCPTATVMPLTNVRPALEAAIDAMVADGGTAGHLGIAWGWYTLSPQWAGYFPGPSAPKPYTDPDVSKSIVMMTDGDFNVSYLNGALNETSFAQGAELCSNIKAKKVTIYTIGFAIDKLAPPKDADAAAWLTDCASSVGGVPQYYLATDAASLMAAFRDIAGKIQALRLTD